MLSASDLSPCGELLSSSGQLSFSDLLLYREMMPANELLPCKKFF